MRVACVPKELLADSAFKGANRYVLYARSTDELVGSVGSSLIDAIRMAGLSPDARAWDLLSVALGAIAADDGCSRSISPDGWTREIDLTVAVSDSTFWATQERSVERLLRFLTGDIWRLTFIDGEPTPPPVDRIPPDHDIVSLLSGGMDSLIGAIDVLDAQRKPILVSQVSKGDKDTQRDFAAHLGNGIPLVQLNHIVRSPGRSERSQRSRSLVFLAYGVLVATSLSAYRTPLNIVELQVPENGFISLNLPLTPLRIGSLSTRTTHPVFMAGFQDLLTSAGVRVRVNNPYQFKTKGEMLRDCRDQHTLRRLVFSSTSCGRFARTSFQHCGRCIPCLVRRAAVHRWNRADETSYRYDDLSRDDWRHRRFEDVRAACIAVENVRLNGIDEWIGGGLNRAQLGPDVRSYLNVASNGIGELRTFLKAAGAL